MPRQHIVTPVTRSGFALIGEMGSQNHVSLSPRRFSAVELTEVSLAFTVRGAPHEYVD
eukprot:COSAG01_NODE_67954_length_265_cov_1.132530_2_plen_57_part_01